MNGAPNGEPGVLDDDTVEDLAVQAATRMDRDALAALYQHFSDKVWRFVHRQCGGVEAVTDEVTSEAWTRVVAKIKLFDPRRGKFVTWLYRLVQNTLNDHLRREGGGARASREVASHLLYYGSDEHIQGASPDEQAVAILGQERIAAAINALPEKQRAICMLTLFDGYSIAEAADIVKMRLSAAKMARVRGLKTVRSACADLDPSGTMVRWPDYVSDSKEPAL